MSTMTNNLALVKPDYSDPADIVVLNGNWDKVDEALGKTQIPSYTELTQFGLSDDDMSPTDFTANIDKIVTTLDGTAATMMFILQDDMYPNLYASVVQKLNADTNIPFASPTHVGWMYIRFSGKAYRPVVIETNLETANYYDCVWTCVYNKGAEGNKVSAFTSGTDILPSYQYGTELPATGKAGQLFFLKA